MTPFDINRLRCLAYHNGLSNYKRALRYALEAYKLPSAREDTEVLLSLVELIADEYYMEGDYASIACVIAAKKESSWRKRPATGYVGSELSCHPRTEFTSNAPRGRGIPAFQLCHKRDGGESPEKFQLG